MNKKKLDRKNIFKITLLVIFVTVILLLAIKNAPWIIEYAKEPEKVREYLRSFGNFGAFIYVLIMALHVPTVVIPGDIFNVCGGYIYGIPLGFVLALTGIMLGSLAVFYISRLLGYEVVSKFISEDKLKKISEILNSNKGIVGLFIICLLPFIPKDLMMYIAGLTPIKASRLFPIYALSRVPGTLIWVSVGANVYEKNISGIVITILCFAVLVIGGIIVKEKIKNKKEKFV